MAQVAHAATFTVTSTDDDSAVDPAVSCDTAGDVCTLRSSIEAANAQAGADTINFNITGGGVHTFTPATAYDQITEQVTIDGSTQTGASCGTLVPSTLPASNTPHALLIEVDGTGAATASDIDIGSGSDNSIVRGLVLNNSQDRPELNISANDVTAECNYIGTNAAGTAAGANNTTEGVVAQGDNIAIQNNLISGNVSTGLVQNASTASAASNNLIGTTATGLSALPNAEKGVEISGSVTINHNVISANTSDGILVRDANSAVTGNYIGVSVNGSALGNGGSGILTDRGTNNYAIGGSGTGEGNLISANANSGISIVGVSGQNCPVNIVSHTFGNKIGTNASGGVQAGFGNGGSGISVNETVGSDCVTSVYKHQIGGDNSGEPNIIAGNAQDGVRVFEYNNPEDESEHTDVFSVSVLSNSIFSNGNLGVNLASSSDQFNGIADVDLGPNALNAFLIDYPASHANNYLNRPTINSNSTSGNNVTVNYDFQAPPGITPSDDGYSLLASDLVGYRLDFYINSDTQDGAYSGYSQGATHLGSFIVDGSETGATHTFTSPVAPSSNQNITATATVLWKVITCQESGDTRQGDGPPYSNNCAPPS